MLLSSCLTRPRGKIVEMVGMLRPAYDWGGLGQSRTGGVFDRLTCMVVGASILVFPLFLGAHPIG